METRFKTGQKVRSLIDQQGLLPGAEYTVVEIHQETHGIFGTFTGYRVQREPGTPALWIGNGHLVLTEASR